MKEKIRKLSLGYVDVELPKVSIEPIQIEETIYKGESRKSEIHITSENRLTIRGFIYSSNPNVRLQSENILGVFIHVPYILDAENLSEGEIVDGEFSIVTNAGEYVIPYSFVVLKGNTEGCDVSTIKGFFNLYNTNLEAAINLYLSPDFISLPFMFEPKTRIIYDGLMESKDAHNSITQFLVAHNMIDEGTSEDTLWNNTPSSLSAERQLLKAETIFDHAKIDFETNDIMSSASLLEMKNAFKNLRECGASIESLKFHKMEINYYKNYSHKNSYNVDRLKSYNHLKKCYESGCRSPYLYLETCKIYNDCPPVFKEYDGLTLGAINFGSRHGFLSEEITSKIAIHSITSKNIPLILLNSMKRMYKYYPSKELLTGIISALIRNESMDESSFKWYLKGINEDVQISRLYDFFIESVPEDFRSQFPKEVYLYYSYNMPTTDNGKKTLYTNIIYNFDKSSPTYNKFEMQIRKYVSSVLFEKRIDKGLAILYDEFLHVDIVDKNSAEILLGILSTHEVVVPGCDNNKLIVLYEELEGEQVVQLNSDKVLLPLFTDRYHFLIEDEIGKRYYKDNIYVTKLINDKDNIFYTCLRYAPETPLARIAIAKHLINKDELSSDEITKLADLANDPGIHCIFRSLINNAICTKHNWTKNSSNIEVLIDCAKDKYLGDEERVQLSNILVDIGRGEEAKHILGKIGYNKLSLDSVLDLCCKYITEHDYDYSDEILGQCFSLYKSSKYNKDILSYLCKNYNGLCSDMANILLLSISENVNVHDVPERLLAQMLFTNQYKDIDEIFKTYVSTSKADKIIVTAYFVFKCFRYFIYNEDISPEILASIKNVLLNQFISGTAPLITRLALVKYYSSLDVLSVDDINICDKVVSSLIEKGAIFPFFKKLSSHISLPEEVKDKTIVTFHAREGDSVALILVPEDDEEEPVYLEMNHVCMGFFVKSVLLFEGEYQVYQIRITRDGVSSIVEEGELNSDIDYNDNTRKFIRLNKLLSGSVNPEDESWQDDMAEYSFDNALSKKIFCN